MKALSPPQIQRTLDSAQSVSPSGLGVDAGSWYSPFPQELHLGSMTVPLLFRREMWAVQSICIQATGESPWKLWHGGHCLLCL